MGAKWVGIYREDTTPRDALEQMKAIRASQEYYRQKGTGRPTKKDRRELDDYLDETE